MANRWGNRGNSGWLYFGGSKITADGDCSHDIKTHLLFGRKILTNLEVKSKGEKERYKHLNAEFQRIARRDKKAFFSNQCKEIEENNRMEKTRDLFRKIRDTKGIFHAKMDLIKDRNGMDLTHSLENPRDSGVTQSWTWLKQLSSSSSKRSRRY